MTPRPHRTAQAPGRITLPPARDRPRLHLRREPADRAQAPPRPGRQNRTAHTVSYRRGPGALPARQGPRRAPATRS